MGGHDALSPGVGDLIRTWAERVRADREQVHRCREVEDPADFYAPVADRFRLDPRRTGDAVLDQLLSIARPGDRWLDIGAGAGRYALPLALRVREVVAIEPSPGMTAVLQASATEHGVGGVRVVAGRWPVAPGADGADVIADVSLMAHVGYDIEAIGPFLDAMEAASRRACVAVMGESAMATVATLFWQAVHGEPRVRLPALPELVVVLLARGRLPEVALVPRLPSTFGSRDELVMMARRQLWVRPGSDKDQRLLALVDEAAVERDGRWSLREAPASIGVITWDPQRDGPLRPSATAREEAGRRENV